MSRRKDIERNNIRDEDAGRIMQQMFGDSPSPVVQAALQARTEYIARGGKPLSRDEINEEVARRTTRWQSCNATIIAHSKLKSHSYK